MKFYIYSNKEYADKDLTRLSTVIKKLFKDAEVEVGKGKLAKYKQERLEAEGGFVLKSEDVLGSTNKQTAYNIVKATNVGISERVLDTL